MSSSSTDIVLADVAHHDVFVLRRVAADRYAHIGGTGRGEGWAGIVELVTAELPRQARIPAPGQLLRLASEEAERRFGPYWSRDFVLVALSRDELVAFGADELPHHDDSTWLATARQVAAAVTAVSPAKRLADELELLHAVRDVALIPRGGVEEVGSRLLGHLAAALSCEVGGLLLGDGRLLVHVADEHGPDPELVRLALRRLVDRHERPDVCVQDAGGSLEGPWLRSYLIRPIGDLATIVLAHTDRGPRGFTALCQSLANSTATAAETVLASAIQYESVRRFAVTASEEARSDALTGLANRRAWDEAVAEQLLDRRDEPVAVVACDVDGMKLVNDTFGHAAGDAHLRAVADVLRGVVRAGDLAVRLGGDEFALLLRNAEPRHADAVAARIRRACDDGTAGAGHPLSLSVGVAHGRGNVDLEDLLRLADVRMYEHKRTTSRTTEPLPEALADADADIGLDAVQPVVGDILRMLLQLPPERLDDGIEDSLSSLGRALGLDRAYVFTRERDHLRNTHEWCAPGVPSHRAGLQDVSPRMIEAWLPAFRNGEAVALEDVTTLPDEAAGLRELLVENGVRSLLVVPMLVHGDVVGFVGLDAVRRHRRFAPGAQQLLRSVADVLVAADSRRHATRRVASVETRMVELLRHTRDHIMLVEADGVVSWASESFHALGVDPASLVGRPAAELTHPTDRRRVDDEVARWLRDGGQEELVLTDHRTTVGGQLRWVSVVLRNCRDQSGVEGVVASVHDVTAHREQTERLRHQSLHDLLTGLPNRALLHDRLGVALQRTDRGAGRVGVLFLDVDGFAVINDSRSHAVGDELLRQVADRLGRAVRQGETAARFGSDQFVVVIEAETSPQVQVAAARLATVFDQPFVVQGERQDVTASYGLRIGDGGADDVDGMLQDADTALIAAKDLGRSRLVTFEPGMRERAVRHDQVVRRLTAAVMTEDVLPHFQPLVDLRSGAVLGAEALARWTDVELGAVSPNEFIPLAESSGVIASLGVSILRQACRAVRTWPDGTYVSVNLSPSQLDDPGVQATVLAALEASAIPPERLVLEVTESLLMRDTRRAIEVLDGLRSTGIRVALDDFGTGHSSLAVLRDLPLDIVKIDRAFVSRVCEDERGALMVDGIVRLAEDLGLVTVAEGVETEGQAERLRAAGCRVAQGWLFGRPVPGSPFG